MEDFQIVTSKSRKALLKLQNDLTKVRSKMRANNNESFVPVTVDELMYQFCTNEKRKEIKTWRDSHKDELMKKSLNGKSDDDVR